MPHTPADPQHLVDLASSVIPNLSHPLYHRADFNPSTVTIGGTAADQGPTDPSGKVAWNTPTFQQRVLKHFAAAGADYNDAMANYARWLVRDTPDNLNNLLSIEHLAATVVWMYYWTNDELKDDFKHLKLDKMLDTAQKQYDREVKQKAGLEKKKAGTK
jgi:hypothetical protein